MRYRKPPGILPVIAALLALGTGVAPAMATDDQFVPGAAGTTATPGQEESSLYYRKPGDFFLGYRWPSEKDALQAAEYVDPHSSLTFGLDLLSCPLPYRYHLNTEFLSKHDFYSDAGFAYKDLVLFRDILVGVHHNLNHLDYQHAGEPPELTYSDRDPGDLYYTDLTSNLFSLRFKAPDFPFHTFINDRYVSQEGRIQQRFLLGNFSQLDKTTAARDIDWESNDVKLGANSHLGPVEMEYAYDQARFQPGDNNILYDAYPDSTARPGDVYPHNVVPETESSAHSVKLHSSYTGGLVTAATLSNLYQKNNYSQTESTTWKGAFDCSWIIRPTVGLFFKYRHRNVDMDAPDTVILAGLGNTLHYPVREAVSYSNDIFSLTSRYRLWPGLSLLGTYEFSYLERKNVAEWPVLPGQTNIHTLTFTADAVPLDKVKVKASCEYKNYENPSYNNTPDHVGKLKLTTTYTPSPGLNLFLYYLLAVTDRDSLYYLNNSPRVLLEFGERDGRSDQILASVTKALSPMASLTASWFYQRFEVTQSLAFGRRLIDGTGGDLPFIDPEVPNADESNSFSLALNTTPLPGLSLSVDVTYTIFEGNTGYDDIVGNAPFDLASFSALKANETVFSVNIAKKIRQNLEVGLRSYLGLYDDRAYGVLDGKELTTICTLKRYF